MSVTAKGVSAFRLLVENPREAPASLLIGAYCSSLVGEHVASALAYEGHGMIEGTDITYKRAIEVLAAEIDRRFPVPG